MGDLGSLTLIIAFVISAYTVVVSVLGYVKKRNDLVISAERGIYANFALVLVSVFSLTVLFLKSDFHYQYIQEYSNRALPLFYKFASLWAGQAGSLLLWLLILCLVSVAAVYQNRNKNRELMPVVIAVLSTVNLFFISVVIFAANPFKELVTAMPDAAAGFVSYTAPDGRGLNPLLQHWAMVIHPPILFVGYSGFVVPFAFALAALFTGKLDIAWIKTTRRWTLTTWVFLTAGILLGAAWAYVELGWGGYWGWDPVENASLLPWLTGTAYLHSVIIQEKRGMFKIWNIMLVIMTFSLCIFGTFLTRSGIISSVHSFAASPIGSFFSSFLLVILVVSAILIMRRFSELKSESQLDSMLSRESSFLFNNLMFILALFTILFGTIFPLITEMTSGTQTALEPAFYNRIAIPIGLILLLLTGVGPLFAWRKTSVYSLKRNFIIPVSASLLFGILLVVLGIRDFYPLIAFVLSYFVFHTIINDYLKGIRVRRKNMNEPFFKAFINLTMRNTRRYGGYIVHAGVVFMFIGFAGNAFNSEKKLELSAGEAAEIGNYSIKLNSIDNGQEELYQFSKVDLTVLKNGEEYTKASPERRYYYASEQTSTEVDLHTTLREDLYMIFEGVGDNNKAVINIHIKPLVMFIWIGSIVIVLGTMIALLPNQISVSKTDLKKDDEKVSTADAVT
ncbi:MAG: heme lyase CcmF/NrfE family subunit [bacterium]|nr:heme lyase CcmF/NrfE family subunit [bacterium]